MAPNPSATMDDPHLPSVCNIAQPIRTEVAQDKSSDTTLTAETQPKPQKHSHSFYKRIRLNPTTKESKKKTTQKTEFVPSPSSSVEEFKSVQSLKQFWINAFGSIKNSQKKGKPPEESSVTSERKCATLGANSKRPEDSNHSDRSSTLHRNFSISSNDVQKHQSSTKPQTTLANNRQSVDNFYKYKNADIVKQRQNSSGDDTVEYQISYLDILSQQQQPQQQSPTIETDTNDEGITMQIRHNALAMDVSPNNTPADKIATTEAPTQSTTTLKLIKTDSSNSLTTSTTNDSVSSSRKSTSTHHGVTRKCSFRTNISSHTNHNHHRKLMATSSGSTSGDSKVAALTHRFNQLCQQDADRIREEVRRNNHVVVHRVNGKVFKVMAEDKMSKKVTLAGRISNDGGSSVRLASKKESIRRKDRPPMKTDNKFIVKPKVPEKSPQVIMRTKEIVEKNKTKVLSTVATARAEINSTILDSQIIIEDTLDSRVDPPTDIRENNCDPIIVTVSEEDILKSIDPITVPITPQRIKEEIPKKKKYVRLYEKFRFRPSFMSSSKKALLRPAPDSNHIITDPDLHPDDPESVQKIIEAISKASQRIELLSKSESCLLISKEEQPAKQNDSFLFRSTTNGISSDYHQHVSGLVEAINPCVLGKARSMDDVFIAEHLISSDLNSSIEVTHYQGHETYTPMGIEKEATLVEDDYEIISPPQELEKPGTLCIESQPSFLYKSISKKQCTVLEKPIVKSEVDCTDIYQSIAEVFNTNFTSSNELPADQESVNSYESFENYESVDEKLIEQIKNENGYEPLDPPPEPPPPRLSTPTISTTSPPSEPPLPVPKRNIQNFVLIKCGSSSSNYEPIKYEKIPPRPPKCAPLPPEPILTLNTSEEDASSPDTENIYDTIAAVAHRLPSSKSTSSYYESVGRQPSFVRSKRFSKISMAESDSGSTMSSDNKTNSLYGATLSRRESVSPPSEPSDNNSDDWVDISDAEQEDGNKLVV